MISISIFGRYAAIVVASAIFAGCSSSQTGGRPGTAQVLPFSQQNVIAPSGANLHGESFSEKKISAKCEASYKVMQFTATGEATGPFPGKFKASGSLSIASGSQASTFSETFAIHSGSQTISGKAQRSGSKINLNCVYLTFLVQKAYYADDGARGRTDVRYGYPTTFRQTFQ